MALALYRKYRPRTFAEVIGQEHVTEPLSQALRSGRLHHAYLFSGPRGCGKTSSARILARSLNCEQGPTPEPCGVCGSCRSLANDGTGSIDVIEIDAASHGGVEDARDLREKAFFAPAGSRYKIYVIDEAHMVSSAGFNALLKLVEEPPDYVKFIFATTEPEKVLGTIKSRTHHYPFRLIPPAVLRPYLQQLAEAEGIHVEPAVFPLVVRAGGGSARDSLSVLDQLIAGAGPEGVIYRRAVSLLGVTDVALIDEMCDALAAGDGATAYSTIDRVAEAGHDARRFASDLLERFRDLIVLQQVPDAVAKGLIDGPADQLDAMTAQATRLGPATLSRCADIVHNGLVEMRGTTAPRLLLELITARMLLPGADDSAGALLQRLERMERRLTLTADPNPDLVRPQPPPASLSATSSADATGVNALPSSGSGGISAARAAAAAAAGHRAPTSPQPDPSAPPPPAPLPGPTLPSGTVPGPTPPSGSGPGATPPAGPPRDSTSAVGDPAHPSSIAEAEAYRPSRTTDEPRTEPQNPPPDLAMRGDQHRVQDEPSHAATVDQRHGEPGHAAAVGQGNGEPERATAVGHGHGEQGRRPEPAGILPDAPEESGDAASAGVPGQLSAAAIREVWHEIITAVGRKSKKVAALASGATVRELDGQTVVLTFRFPAHAKMVAAEPDLIANALYEALGGSWQIRCEIAGEGDGVSAASATSVRRPSASASTQVTPAHGGSARAASTGVPGRQREAAAPPVASAHSSDDDDWPEPARPGGLAATSNSQAADPDQREGGESERQPVPGRFPAGSAEPSRSGRPDADSAEPDAGPGGPGADVAGQKSAGPGGPRAASDERDADSGDSLKNSGSGGIQGAGGSTLGASVSGLAAARAAAAGARNAAAARPTAIPGPVTTKPSAAWSDDSPAEEPPYDPEYDGPVRPGAAPGYEGFDPGDEPLDDVIDEKTARQSSEQQAMQLLQDAFGAEKIGES